MRRFFLAGSRISTGGLFVTRRSAAATCGIFITTSSVRCLQYLNDPATEAELEEKTVRSDCEFMLNQQEYPTWVERTFLGGTHAPYRLKRLIYGPVIRFLFVPVFCCCEMNKLPLDFDGKFFVGKTLEYVSFAEYSVYFSFEKKITVTVESSLQHLFQLSGEEEKQSIPLTESSLMQLVGHAVTKVLAGADGTLVLEFDNGHLLRVFDDLPNYESYSIQHGDIEIFV